MITSVEPQVNMTGKYPIGQAADILNINRNTLRDYAKKGMIKFSLRRESGRMVFEGRELVRFWRAAL